MATTPAAISLAAIQPAPQARAEHLRWLLELTATPSASGKEWRVERWIESWAASRPWCRLQRDDAGNITLAIDRRPGGPWGAATPGRPLYFTAHTDHPAFVIERIIAPTLVEASFRGGVMADYFPGAGVVAHTREGRAIRARATAKVGTMGPLDLHHLELAEAAGELAPGDVAVWDVGPAHVDESGLVRTLACDDLSAAAAALAAFDELAHRALSGEPVGDVRVLLTRAEEIGFVGAIAACKSGTMPMHARVIALENSRSFIDSPIGGGPIVRVGDRLSVFSPSLTGAIAQRAEALAGAPAQPVASQKMPTHQAWKWQRKLMAGGACEASVFAAAGYEATCVCLPLGNYHNMADLDAVQSRTNTTPPAIGPEFIARRDYEGLVDLLIACGMDLPPGGVAPDRFDTLWRERRFVLG